MERGYIKSKDLDISNNLLISDTTNPESNPYANIYYGIFKCIKKDLDYISRNNFNIPYISDKTTASTGGAAPQSITINTVSCEPGDLLLVIGEVNNNRTWSSEAGWTLETQSPSTPPNIVVYSRIATGTENSTYSFDWTAAGASSHITMLCIKKHSSFNVGSFGAQANPPTIPVPDDASDKKLLLFAIANNGNGRSWDINSITEYQIVDLQQDDGSLDVSAIYRTSSNTSLSYTTTQTGAGSNSHGLTIVVK